MTTQERPASRTAIGVAVLRALHELYDEPPKILSDPIIPLLLGDEVLQPAKASQEWRKDSLTSAIRSHVVLRSRYAEDCLHEAVDSGVRQYVILGSGFDTFAYRQPTWAAPLSIFEIDHPASQRDKVERLRLAGIPIPANVEFVPADFEAAALPQVLSSSSLDLTEPAFFSCLGVLVYLPADSVNAVFRLTASFPKRSEIVFTFSQGTRSSDGQPNKAAILADASAAAGEPWRTYHDPDALRRDLLEMGFSQVSFLSPQQAKDLYYREGDNSLPPPRRASIARAFV